MPVSERALTEQLGIGCLAERLCEHGESVIGYIIFKGMRHRVVARQVGSIHPHGDIAKGVVDVGSHLVKLARQRCRSVKSLVCRVDVEATEALKPSVGYDGDRGVALHCPRLTTIQLPLGHPPPLLIHIYHRAYHLLLLVGEEQGLELRKVAVGVPQGEHGVAVGGCLKRLVALHTRILAVDILQDVGMYLRVVKGCIEHAALLFGSAFHRDAAEGLCPYVVSLLLYAGKIACGLFGIKVLAGIGYAYKRHTYLHLHLLGFL